MEIFFIGMGDKLAYISRVLNTKCPQVSPCAGQTFD